MGNQRATEKDLWDDIKGMALTDLRIIAERHLPLKEDDALSESISHEAHRMVEHGMIARDCPELADLLVVKNAQNCWRLFRRMYSEWLVTRHGVATDRVRNLFARLEKATTSHLTMALFCWELDAAIRSFGSTRALDLLEAEDLSDFCRRLRAMDDLRPPKPVCTLEELGELTRACLAYLERNRDDLIATGWPRTEFTAPLFLLRHLVGCLYFVKLPVEPRRFIGWPDKDSTNDGCVLAYRWLDDTRVNDHPSLPVKAEGYEHARILEVLEKRNALRLESLRERVFQFKVGVLERLLAALESGKATLWEGCIRLLAEALSSDEVDFLLRMDHLYMGYDSGDRETPEGFSTNVKRYQWQVPHPGGLTDILTAIGHYEEKVSIGCLARTKSAMGDLLQWVEGEPKDDDFWLWPPAKYHEIFGTSYRQILDGALDQYLSLKRETQKFWAEYPNQVNEAIRTLFLEKSAGMAERGLAIETGQTPLAEAASGGPEEASLPEAKATLPPEQRSPKTEYVPADDILWGWQQIAEHFNLSLRAVRKLARDHGMPVRRPNGWHVSIREAELDEWYQNLK